MEKPSTDAVDQLLAALTPPSCEYKLQTGDQCGDPAGWLLMLSCGDTIYTCDSHQSQLAAWVGGSAVLCILHREIGAISYNWRRI